MLRVLLIGTFLLIRIAAATGGVPHPPCVGSPLPDYPSGSAPTVTLWRDSALPSDWPPSCVRWSSRPFTVMVTVAGRISGIDVDTLLTRVGAFSTMKSVHYWSANRKEWERLFEVTTALAAPDAEQPRPDFSAADLRAGGDHFFLQEDNRSGDSVVYRLKIDELTSDRIVFETENISPVRKLLITLYEPGEFHSIYFLARTTMPAGWTYYSLSWVGPGPPLMDRFVRPESYVNRATALFRYLAGIPTDSMPPAAP